MTGLTLIKISSDVSWKGFGNTAMYFSWVYSLRPGLNGATTIIPLRRALGLIGNDCMLFKTLAGLGRHELAREVID